ncbi:hypothetical protein [Burkholderia anthina]|uniref:hypothetical protein n=1 Tax=Burkholderia anthina TaxID=179879 RepID=UPI0012D8D7B0|nr:hypothetical protein [Burkholderia anthina]
MLERPVLCEASQSRRHHRDFLPVAGGNACRFAMRLPFAVVHDVTNCPGQLRGIVGQIRLLLRDTLQIVGQCGRLHVDYPVLGIEQAKQQANVSLGKRCSSLPVSVGKAGLERIVRHPHWLAVTGWAALPQLSTISRQKIVFRRIDEFSWDSRLHPCFARTDPARAVSRGVTGWNSSAAGPLACRATARSGPLPASRADSTRSGSGCIKPSIQG